MPRAYYNEIDPYAAQWLRNLIEAGHIAPGDVDERDIRDVYPSDLHGYTQCHFFAGIGVWSLALRRAGWRDDRPVWTGSCPCQPFSAAGRRSGFTDERHLWPAWYHLISERRPGVVFGEQVASQDGLGWLDVVHADMEAANYAVGSIDLCSAGVGSDNGRQRLYFVADADRQRFPRGSQPHSRAQEPRQQAPQRRNARGCGEDAQPSSIEVVGKDGKRRRLEPGVEPLVASYPGRVDQLRAYGNAINAEAAVTFILSYLDVSCLAGTCAGHPSEES
ncbi:DNA cytosine methyltransferase [Salinicola sp. CR57]|uniref:DNA cytosine methyltransferase n=1 Tax=Salinicola sp. CR57 TaxID=1949086 RepID=UPI000DA13C99|nr:DNA cytosine methyltransferase [Salinicola sp. CR57]